MIYQGRHVSPIISTNYFMGCATFKDEGRNPYLSSNNYGMRRKVL